MTFALSLAAMTILNWITIETAALAYLVMVAVGYVHLFIEIFRENTRERPTSK